jgi:hypothetical protein
MTVAVGTGGLQERTDSHQWTFTTVQEDGLAGGWKVDDINGPDFCGTYLKCTP